MRRYATILIGILLGGLAGVAGVNLVIDPYGVTNGPSIPGFNAEKTRQYEDGGRIAVSARLMNGGLGSIILGSSRAVDGFPRRTDDWPGGLYNAGMRGSNIFELTRAMAVAARDPALRCVAIGLDLDEFGDHSKAKATYWITALPDGDARLGLARMALSPHTLARSAQTVFDNATGGAPAAPFRDAYEPGEQRARYFSMIGNASDFMRGYRFDPDRLDFFSAALDRLTAEGVQVIGFIHPVHAFREELLFMGGGEARYFAFRRDLATLFAEYAARESAKPCAPGGAAVLWDFSGFQDFASTPPPGESETAAHPYFHEPAHYLPAVGKAMLGRMRGEKGDGVFSDVRFGLRLTPITAHESERAILARRDSWRRTPAGEIFIEEAAPVFAGRAAAPMARSYLNRDDWRDLEKALAAVPPRATSQPQEP